MSRHEYLRSAPFMVRQVIAAYYLRKCSEIIEIGSCKVPITGFLSGYHDRVWCVDSDLAIETDSYSPSIYDGRRLIVTEASFIHKPFYEVDFSAINDGFGFCALGVDFDLKYLNEFSQLVHRSKIAVLEGWDRFEVYRTVLDHVLFATKKSIQFCLHFDLSDNDYPRFENSFPPRFSRELVVLR